MNLAPIVLFVYNRPWHTEQTLRALQQNDLASESELYIYADGPKPHAEEKQLQQIRQVREIIRREQWCATVHIIESETNKGLADSVIAGVTEVVNRHGRVIVLEDDLVVSHAFLNYMNAALEYYQEQKSVFSISSDIPMNMPQIKPYDYDVFVSYRNFSYGWATWSDRWQQVDWAMTDYQKMQSNIYMQSAFNRGGDDLVTMFEAQYLGNIDSWAVRFTWAHFCHHAVSIMPTQTFVHHIGFDGSGIHCSSGITDNRILNQQTTYNFLPVLYEDARFINAFYNTYYRAPLPLYKRAINKIWRIAFGKKLFTATAEVFLK